MLRLLELEEMAVGVWTRHHGMAWHDVLAKDLDDAYR